MKVIVENTNLGIEYLYEWFRNRYRLRYISRSIQIAGLSFLYRGHIEYYCIDLVIDRYHPEFDNLVNKTLLFRRFNIITKTKSSKYNQSIMKYLDKATVIRIHNLLLEFVNALRRFKGFSKKDINIAIDINDKGYLDILWDDDEE